MENGPARQQHRLPQDERAVRTKAWLNKALLSPLAGRRSQIEMRDWFNFCFGGGERGRRRQRGIDCPILRPSCSSLACSRQFIIETLSELIIPDP